LPPPVGRRGEKPLWHGSGSLAGSADVRSCPIDTARRFGCLETALEIPGQSWGKRVDSHRPSTSKTLSPVEEPFGRQEIRIDQAGEEHADQERGREYVAPQIRLGEKGAQLIVDRLLGR
jgi:hypothetical protein